MGIGIDVLLIMGVIIGVAVYVKFVLNSSPFGAPYLGTQPEVVERMIQLAALKPGEMVYDLGSGDGRMVIAAALHGADAYGVEIDPIRLWYSKFWITLLRLSKHAHILHGNLFNVDITHADAVFLFLTQATNEKLRDKLERELKPGARVISYIFTMEGWEPTDVDVIDQSYGAIYVYVPHPINATADSTPQPSEEVQPEESLSGYFPSERNEASQPPSLQWQ